MERSDLQRHRVGSAHHPIRCQRSALAAGVASETGHGKIHMDICAVRDGELVGVRSHCQLHLTIGQHAHTPSISADHQPGLPGGIRQATIPHPLAIPHALGLGEGDKLLRHAARVLPDEGTGLPVGIVIPRTATVVGVAVELARQPHREAYPGKRQRGLIALHRGAEGDRPVRTHGPDIGGGKGAVLRSEGLLRMILELKAPAHPAAEVGAIGRPALHPIEDRQGPVGIGVDVA